jgi:hypothetical protein
MSIPCGNAVDKLWYYGGDAPVAQWIEHLTSDQGVAGSSPAWCALEQVADYRY